MNKSFVKAALIFLPILFILLSIQPAYSHNKVYAQGYFEDFEDGQAHGWELESGWQIIADGSNKVLSGQGHQWARSNQECDDCNLSFRLKVARGSIHLVFRMNDSGRYFIRFDSEGSMLSKQYFPDTFQYDLKSKSTKHALNAWHQVEIKGEGPKLTLKVDGKVEWTFTDSKPILEGNFAFESQENAQVFLDDIALNKISASAVPTQRMNPTVAPVPQKSLTIATSPTATLKWVFTGGPLGGLGYDIRISQDDPEKMYVTDAFAGIFMSEDGGKNWFASISGIDVRDGTTGDIVPVFSATIDPSNSNIIWIGTQNHLGVYKSTNGGATWKRMVNGITERHGIHFRGFTVDPTNSDVVYAAAEISSWVDGKPARNGVEFDLTRGVVYKTTDGGKNWKAVWRGENLARYVWINPKNTDVVYVSTGIFDREANNSDPVKRIAGGVGVLKSEDGGKTWRQMNNGLGNLYVGSLFMHPSNPEILLAGVGNNVYSSGGGIYLSTNGGGKWDIVFASMPAITSVEFSISNPSIAYAGSEMHIYRSNNGGVSWKRVSLSSDGSWGAAGTRGGFPIDFQVDFHNPEKIFINAYGGGNFLSEDGGRTWKDASRGYTGALVRSIVVDQNKPARVLAGGRSGLFITTDGGEIWNGLCRKPLYSTGWQVVAIDPYDPIHFLAGSTDESTLGRSRDGGLSWTPVMTFDESEKKSWSSITFAPSDASIVYAGTAGYLSAGAFDYSFPGKGIYKSVDNGRTWEEANDNLSKDANVVMLAVDPSNSQVVLAATSNHGLVRTNDGGMNWNLIKGGLPGSRAVSVAIHPNNSKIIAAGFERQGLFISSNGGSTWKRSSSGMPPEGLIKAILFDPVHPDEIMYAGDFFGGVYRSMNGGKTWSAINNGLLNREVNGLSISEDGLHLYAATEGAGVFRLDLNGLPPV